MHKICYKNSLSGWNEALPLGNGHFGAMFYNDGDELVYAVNHYDVYYRKLEQYTKEFKEERKKVRPTDTSRFEMIRERALKAHEDPTDPAHYNYNFVSHPEIIDNYGVNRMGQTLPLTGELRILPDESVKAAYEFESSLEIENAVHKYSAKTGKGDITISTIIGQDTDIILSQIKQTENKIRSVEITVPKRRYHEIQSEYRVYDSNTVYFINSFYPGKAEKDAGTPFKYIFMLRLAGGKCSGAAIQEGKAILDTTGLPGDFNLMTCVVTQEETADLLKTAVKRLDEAEKGIDGIIKNHKEYWDKFWNKSSISITDSMLEKLWYMNLYSLECSSGRGARLYEQACGLNGLWDIKQPSQWGSSWYWDVNIEESYWPVYTSNHLELSEVFYKALLSYVDLAKKRAKEFYGFRGIATDYPFDFYIGMWPWCAQYLWWHYLYSGDEEFLREKAYPLFKDILLFFEDYISYDEEKDQYYTFPDVSPEQGPMTRNATMPLVSFRFLLKAAIEANSILNENKDDSIRWQEIYNKLPLYPIGESKEFGKTIKCSEWASPLQYLNHSSLLSPCYPIGEISKRSSEELKQIGKNTLKYAETLQCIGTHSFGWEASAAARLGYGDEAVRFLYEKGIMFLMSTNGLFSEETGRWIQNCNTASAPVYNPPLIESGSATVAAINEMLLQSFDGIIEVFPSLPKGERPAFNYNKPYNSVIDVLPGRYEAWKDCHFENLLAEGAFEVSASQKGSETAFVKIKSLAGNGIKLVNPFISKKLTVKCEDKDIEFELTDNLICFETQKGNIYEIKAVEGSDCHSCENGIACSKNESLKFPDNNPEIYVGPTKRRVFLGKNEETDFLRELDNITFDFYHGNIATSRVSVYRFDFSLPKDQMEKDYRDILPRQFHACGKQGLDFIRITKDTEYTPYRGYGWDNTESLRYLDRGTPDPLRRDFICGKDERKFQVELMKGQYQVFIATGDCLEKTYTEIVINGQQKWKPEGVIKAGRFEAVVLPAVQYKDGIMDISISAKGGFDWKIGMIIINRLL